MHITCISDTHGLHRQLKLVPGDLLIHAGDISEYGTEDEIFDFTQWFAKQPFTYKIFIAGNHDLFLETIRIKAFQKLIGNDIIYLQNSEVKIEGLKIYGSPFNLSVIGMAFGKNKGAEIRKAWRKIPADVDILITHEAPLNILDNGNGCPDLKLRSEIIKPKLHVFGHVHDVSGVIQQGDTRYVNAALCGNQDILQMRPKMTHKPIFVELLK